MNNLILTNLKELEKEARFQKDKWRSVAYNKAIKAIEKYPEQITSGTQSQNIDGVGINIAKKIQEILNTGQLAVVEQNREKNKEKHTAMELFITVWGIGESKAEKLFSSGCRILDDLQIPEIHKTLTAQQQIGLRYYDDLNKRAPREQLTLLSKSIRQTLDQFVITQKIPKIRMRLCGSYRRHAPDSGDIDILLSCDSPNPTLFNEIIKTLKQAGILIEHLSVGSHKYMGITQLNNHQFFRIDFEMVAPHEWPFALLYFTGSGEFNKRQRYLASQLGFSLSEHGLKSLQTNEMIPNLKTERDIFRQLKMDYPDPTIENKIENIK